MAHLLYQMTRSGLFVPRYDFVVDGQVKYTAQARSIFSSYTKFLYDEWGHILLMIDKPSIFSSKMEIYRDDDVIATFRPKVFSGSCTVDLAHTCYELVRSTFSADYTFKEGDHEFAKVSKKVLSISGKTGIAIDADYNQELVLALIVCVMDTNRRKKSS